jgi:arylsulfatase A-like enzyme
MNRKQRKPLGFAAAIAVGLLIGGARSVAQDAPRQADPPPNIIFLMTDQQRWDCLGALNPRIKTPHLDRLARQGILFRQAVCPAPMCVPSRYAMMLGLYPSQLGVYTNADSLADDQLPAVALPEILRKAGYQTAGFGKTHWRRPLPSTRGFEVRAIGEPRDSLAHEAGALMITDDNPEGLKQYFAEVATFGPGEEGVQGYIGCVTKVPTRNHRDGWVAEQCLKFLDKGVDPKRPLFLYLSFLKPHAGFNVPKEFEDLYDINDIPDIAQPPWREEPDTHLAAAESDPSTAKRYRQWREAWEKMTPLDRRRTTLRYYANCSWLDAYLGQVLDKLKQLGRLENSLIVYTSDHGEMLGERNFCFSKYCLFESSVRVPLILAGSAIPPPKRGTIDDRPAELIDLVPTLVRAAGRPVDPSLPGLDLLGQRRREGSFSEFHGGGSERKPAAPVYMWRKQDWKLILCLPGRTDDAAAGAASAKGELYNLKDDPHEWKNLYREPKYAAVREQMKTELLAHLGRAVVSAAKEPGIPRAEFREPSLRYKSRPLWFWNDPNPTTAGIGEIMQKCRDACGYYGFGILPMVAPEKYLGEEYFARYGDALRKAAALGMKMCLYDEYWFPSGSAGGQFQKRFPELTLKALAMRADDVQGPKTYRAAVPEGALMGVVAMNTATSERLDITGHADKSGKLVYEVPAGSWKIMFFTCRKTDQNLMDYFNPEAVRGFLQITHEQYYKHFPEHFGTTIDSVFYDEPPLYRANTWTPDFNDKFQAKYGYNPLPLYPALWMDIGPQTAAARNALFGFRADLFATQYIKAMNDWCRAHKVQLTGHMDQEQVQNPTCISGDLLKVFKHQDISGIDEVFAYRRTQRAYKLISSSAYNWDKPLVMSETYGGIGNMPVDILYRMAMDEYAKGINLLVPHAVWYDPDPGRVVFQPELSYRNARYGPALPEFNKYVGRLNLLLQHGRHVADIAVLYPIATLHAGYRFDAGNPYDGGLPVPEADYLDVGEMLALDARRDFTFLHPEALDEKCVLKGNCLRLENKNNWEEYRVLVLPGMKVVHLSNLQKVRQFYDAGGAIIATTQLPYQSVEPGKDQEVRAAIKHIFGRDPDPSAGPPAESAVRSSAAGGKAFFLARPDAARLQSALAQALDVYDVQFDKPLEVKDGNLTYIHKVKAGRDIYFFANSSNTAVDTDVRLRGKPRLELWDPHTGEQTPLKSAPQRQGSQDVTVFRLVLPAQRSVFAIGSPVEP